MDRQRSPDFNRPRMRFISPALRFFPLGIFAPPPPFHYFSTPTAAFSHGFSPVCLTAASVIPGHFFFSSPPPTSNTACLPSLRFVKETIMVWREEKLVSILPACVGEAFDGIRSLARDASPRPGGSTGKGDGVNGRKEVLGHHNLIRAYDQIL